MRTKLKTDKGVAGLTVLLSLVTFLFVIGLMVMIFSLMGGELQESVYTEETTTVQGEDVDETYFVNGTGYTLAESGYNSKSYSIIAVYNNTNELLGSGNYTLTGNVLTNATTLDALVDVKVNYTYISDVNNTATDVMRDTVSGVSDVTDWFSIFIVIGAMVVLILLTVIIITAIRGSGLLTGTG